MDIIFEKISPTNRAVAEAMQVAPGQEAFIETVPACLIEADNNPAWNPILIKAAHEYVAFAMYGLCKDDINLKGVWLDRFLIDRKFQGRGYSHPILVTLVEHIKAQFGCVEIILSVYDTNPVAIALYEKIGFQFNGLQDHNGEKLMVIKFK